MNDAVINAIPVQSSQHIPFHCSGCSKCCHHVRESVPLESLDLFRLAQYLKKQGVPVRGTDDVIERFAKPAMLDECGYFVLFLRVNGPDDACIFLNGNRCSIHSVKPRACRMYPFVVDPQEDGSFKFLLSKEYEHHFCGTKVHVRTWVKKYFTAEDRAFLQMDMGSAKKIAKLLHRIPEEKKTTALLHFLRYKYSEFDLDKPFLDQYRRNEQKLLLVLRKMADNTGGNNDV